MDKTDYTPTTADCMAGRSDPPKTLRDEFAMAALQGLLAADNYSSASYASKDAYNLADAMMEARNG